MPRIFDACSRTSPIDFATLTPPPLPRPPAWICALTTQTLPPSVSAAFAASSTENAGMPRGVGTPNLRKISLPWYSWIFTDAPVGVSELSAGIVPIYWHVVPAQSLSPNALVGDGDPVAFAKRHWIPASAGMTPSKRDWQWRKILTTRYVDTTVGSNDARCRFRFPAHGSGRAGTVCLHPARSRGAGRRTFGSPPSVAAPAAPSHGCSPAHRPWHRRASCEIHAEDSRL